MRAMVSPSLAKGRLNAPPSKSMAHRYLICAALSEGKSEISPIEFSEDVLATLDCIKALGATVEQKENRVVIDGVGRNLSSGNTLFCRESGSTLRFFVPLCLLNGEKFTLAGTERLFERPLLVYETLCREKGFFYEKAGNTLTLSGTLQPGLYEVPGNISSQFITGLLFALATLSGDSTLLVTGEIESASYVDLTLSVMKEFGVNIEKTEKGYKIPGGQKFQNGSYRVEADLSNAAFLEAFSYLGGSVSLEGLPSDSLQGDRVYKAYFDALSKGYSTLDLKNCPDLGPVLMAFASLFHGAKFTSTKRLKIKESDRGACMAEELSKCGVSVKVEENCIFVEGGKGKAPSVPLSSHNDHRIAMALTVLLSRVGGEIDGAECVKKSYPSFFEEIKKLGIKVKLK